jgi:hypothetical protein
MYYRYICQSYRRVLVHVVDTNLVMTSLDLIIGDTGRGGSAKTVCLVSASRTIYQNIRTLQ